MLMVVPAPGLVAMIVGMVVTMETGHPGRLA